MERLQIAEFQLQKVKLISRDIRRALLAEFPGRLPGHSRFLDTFARAMGYSSYNHLSGVAKTQFESNVKIFQGVNSRLDSTTRVVMKLLETEDPVDKEKITMAINTVIEKHGGHEQMSGKSIPVPKNENNKRGDQNVLRSPKVDERCNRIKRRRAIIFEKVNNGNFKNREVDVGLKAVLHICAKWGLSEGETSALVYGPITDTAGSQTRLLERLSYLLRIYKLLNNIQQGDIDRAQDWIRRAMPVFGGRRPLDMMKDGPTGSAEIMEYLQHVLNGGS